MPLRAIDFHVHLPTPDWLDGSMAGYVEAAEAYFRSSVTRQSLEELAAFYRGLELKAVLLAWDAETATAGGCPGSSCGAATTRSSRPSGACPSWMSWTCPLRSCAPCCTTTQRACCASNRGPRRPARGPRV